MTSGSQAEVKTRSGVLADVQRAIIAHAQLELGEPEPTPVLGLNEVLIDLRTRSSLLCGSRTAARACGAVLGLVSGDDR
ncbi:MAG: hypothetical protein ACRDTA_06105 [Pseudonocardiaceae bacterium]